MALAAHCRPPSCRNDDAAGFPERDSKRAWVSKSVRMSRQIQYTRVRAYGNASNSVGLYSGAVALEDAC